MGNDSGQYRGSVIRVDRRRFLQSAGLAGAAAALGAPTIVRGRGLNEKLNLAIIGSGGRGRANLTSVASENIVALCDVNEQHVLAAALKHPSAKKFADFRRLYDDANAFDAVVVSTPEHTHAVATMPALELGKHVYCEKPLTYNIWEARVIREAAAKTKLATQMGNQNHANENFRQVIELVRTRTIGAVREVHVWVSRAWGWQPSQEVSKQARDIVYVQERPSEPSPVPQGLDWDLWLGPAPQRPFHDVYLPGPKWYRWWDFGNGTMSDLGSHWIDLPFWAMELKAPLAIEAQGPPPHPELAPASMQVTYEYGARGELPPLALTWYQGTNKPRVWTEGGIPQWTNGILFVGEKGMILADYGKHVLLPEKEFTGFRRPEPFLPRSPGHHAEWIRACKTGEPTMSDFEYAGWLTEANHLGNVAFRTGQKLVWDSVNLRATNTSDADRFIRRDYRKGWRLV